MALTRWGIFMSLNHCDLTTSSFFPLYLTWWSAKRNRLQTKALQIIDLQLIDINHNSILSILTVIHHIYHIYLYSFLFCVWVCACVNVFDTSSCLHRGVLKKFFQWGLHASRDGVPALKKSYITDLYDTKRKNKSERRRGVWTRVTPHPCVHAFIDNFFFFTHSALNHIKMWSDTIILD